MTTIPKSMFPLKTSFNIISSMKEQYDKLQQQLATGERAQTLAEMGSSRFSPSACGPASRASTATSRR